MTKLALKRRSGVRLGYWEDRSEWGFLHHPFDRLPVVYRKQLKEFPSVEIGGWFSVKQHMSSAVRVLTRGSSPVNRKLRLESHGGGLEEVFAVLDACRFHFFSHYTWRRRWRRWNHFFFLRWFSCWAMCRSRVVVLPCLWAFRFLNNVLGCCNLLVL